MEAAANAVPETDVEPKPTALAPRPSAPIAVKTPRAVMLAAALEEEREQRVLLAKYVNEFMVKGEDYGEIPGTKRPTLLKPGAEKLFDLFRCRPEYEFISRDVDREHGLYSYEIKCKAVSRETDTVLNEGVGSASSYESKYRYRTAGKKCPSCDQEAITKSKYPPRGRPKSDPGGWWCTPKKGGCGAEFDHDDPKIAEQPGGKVQNPDLADVANTVLKMAKKRAQVDCAIALARVSDMFTQDVEDMVDLAGGDDAPPPDTAPPKQTAKPKAAPAPSAPASAPVADGHKAALALWTRAERELGPSFRDAWKNACESHFQGQPLKTTQWTMADVKAVEAALFAPDDIPF